MEGKSIHERSASIFVNMENVKEGSKTMKIFLTMILLTIATGFLLSLIAADVTIAQHSTPLPHVLLCHQPGSQQQTKLVPPPAVQGHWDHGDYPGACEPWPPPGPPSTPLPHVTLCHQPGPQQQTKLVPPPAVQGHWNHGDYPGACDPWPPPALLKICIFFPLLAGDGRGMGGSVESSGPPCLET